MRTRNKVFLLGSVGKDPEMRSTGGGTLVANCSMATSESYKDQSGEWQTKTEWHQLTAFARTAELFRDYVQKGSKIDIEGKLQTQSWDKDGVKHYKTVIIVDELILLGDPNGGDGTKSRQASGNSQRRDNNSSQQRNSQNQSRGGNQNNRSNGGRRNEDYVQQEIDDESIPF